MIPHFSGYRNGSGRWVLIRHKMPHFHSRVYPPKRRPDEKPPICHIISHAIPMRFESQNDPVLIETNKNNASRCSLTQVRTCDTPFPVQVVRNSTLRVCCSNCLPASSNFARVFVVNPDRSETCPISGTKLEHAGKPSVAIRPILLPVAEASSPLCLLQQDLSCLLLQCHPYPQPANHFHEYEHKEHAVVQPIAAPAGRGVIGAIAHGGRGHPPAAFIAVERRGRAEKEGITEQQEGDKETKRRCLEEGVSS